jgi:16S rRNA U1498 N3-methylase RsmE
MGGGQCGRQKLPEVRGTHSEERRLQSHDLPPLSRELVLDLRSVNQRASLRADPDFHWLS